MFQAQTHLEEWQEFDQVLVEQSVAAIGQHRVDGHAAAFDYQSSVVAREMKK